MERKCKRNTTFWMSIERKTSNFGILVWRSVTLEKYRRDATILCVYYNIFVLYLYERNERNDIFESRLSTRANWKKIRGWIKHARLFFQFTGYKIIFALPGSRRNLQTEITDEILATRAGSLVAIMTTSFMHSVTFVKRAMILCHPRTLQPITIQRA